MKKVTTLLKSAFVATLLVATAGQAAAFPTKEELKDKTYTFKGTLTREGTANENHYKALTEEFEFSFADPFGFGNPQITGFIVNANLAFDYDQSTGKLTFTDKRGMITGVTGQIYFATVDAPTGAAGANAEFACQISEDGSSIKFPDFQLRDYISDKPFATYSNITASTDSSGDNDEEKDSYPAAGEFDGWYTYTCSDFSLEDTSYDFTKELTFQVVTNGPTVSVKGFFLESVNCEYDATTGELTLNSVYFRAGTGYVGIAPEGKWTGMAGATANKMVWKIDEDGNITIPPFDLVTFQTTTVLKTIAKYGTGTVTKTTEPEPEPEPGLDFTGFVGKYTFHGTKTDYAIEGFTGFETEDNTAENVDLTFEINQYGQISDFNGYKLDDNKVGNFLNNRGVVDGNVYTIEMETHNGIYWYYGNEDSEGAYTELFGAPGKTWVQGNPAFTLTKNDDGTFSLSDIAIVLKYSYDSDGDGTSENYFTTLTSWTGLEFGPAETPDLEGIESIAGMWTLPLYDRYADSPLGEFNAEYKVSIDGTTVTFTEIVENNEGSYHLIGKFTDKSTIVFNREIVGNPSSKYPLRVIPFVNTTDVTDFGALAALYQPLTAEYDSEAGTLTFPEKSGVVYGNTDETWAPSGSAFDPKGNWVAAFDFRAPGYRTGDIEATIKLGSQNYEIAGNSVTVDVEFETTQFAAEDAASWTINLTETIMDAASETDTTLQSTITPTVENGVAHFVIADLANGNHDFGYTLTAFDAEGKAIATSNGKALSVYIGPNIAIRRVDNSVDHNNIIVSFTHAISGIDLDNATFKARFVDKKTVTDENEAGVPEEVDVTLNHEDGTGSASLKVDKLGTYNHYVTLVAYDNAGNQLAESNRLDITSTVDTASGIIEIGADSNASTRYFNLNGVEVTNPQAGSILIKVTEGKASKVLVK